MASSSDDTKKAAQLSVKEILQTSPHETAIVEIASYYTKGDGMISTSLMSLVCAKQSGTSKTVSTSPKLNHLDTVPYNWVLPDILHYKSSDRYLIGEYVKFIAKRHPRTSNIAVDTHFAEPGKFKMKLFFTLDSEGNVNECLVARLTDETKVYIKKRMGKAKNIDTAKAEQVARKVALQIADRRRKGKSKTAVSVTETED